MCVGLNYKTQAGESGVEAPKAPLLFGKFDNTLLGDGDAIVLQPGIGHVDSEAELAVVIGEHKVSMRDGDVVEVEIEGIGVLRNELRTASRDL